MPTHEVLNQAPPLLDYDPYGQDLALQEGVRREGGAWREDAIRAHSRRAGSVEVREWGNQANRNEPVLRTHDRFGNRIDEVEFHPAWHQLMSFSLGAELHSLPWTESRAGAHVARAAGNMLTFQHEAGTGCPVTMTFACIPALRKEPALAREWEPRILSKEYDPRAIPASQKRGVTIGMAMTEKQGGSDVRANTTRAVAAGDHYELTGHKWFCSAPMSDAFLMLAQAPGGLTCFLVPRWRPDGTRNEFRIQRLKDKLGNRSNASSEIELEKTFGWRVGEEGRGVPTIIEMVHHTRLDCVLGSASYVRQGLVQAFHHASHRQAFGKRLLEQPLMRNVLSDLALESEAATVLAMRLARAFDRRDAERAFGRIATAVSKYWVCKRAPWVIYESLECLGGAGYVEESILPRLYREAPLNSIWEGSGNVNALDVLRAMAKEPDAAPAFLAELHEARGADKNLDAWTAALEKDLHAKEIAEDGARRLAERMALGLQASLLVRHSPAPVADAFCASRLGGDWGRCFGTLPARVDFGAILKRAWPA